MTMYQTVLQDLQSMSASGNGTAIFYSGQQTNGNTVTNNQTLAVDCQQANPNSTYTIF
jgi:hypothetical protein